MQDSGVLSKARDGSIIYAGLSLPKWIMENRFCYKTARGFQNLCAPLYVQLIFAATLHDHQMT
jgi:hypothetical protein